MAQLPAYHPEPRHTRHGQPRRVSFSVVGAVARLLVNITIIAAIVVGAVLYAHKRTVNARTSQVLSNPPPVFPVFSTGPNDVVVLGCFGRGVERKGKDPYMPGLFYQYSRTFSRADGLYAAGLFCDEVIKDVVVMGTQEDGKVEMVEHTYETFFGSKKVTARAQWDVLGEYDPRCKKGAMKLEFGADPDARAKCVQYLSQPIQYCGDVTTNQQSLITTMNKQGGSFFKDCIFWSVYLAPPGRGPSQKDTFF